MISRVIAVTGGRKYANRQVVYDRMDREMLESHDVIIHGNARGADSLVADWARSHGIHTAVVDALWWKFDKAAGAIRNGVMVLLRPHKLIAFPGGKGTEDMIRQAHEAGIMVDRVSE